MGLPVPVGNDLFFQQVETVGQRTLFEAWETVRAGRDNGAIAKVRPSSTKMLPLLARWADTSWQIYNV
jgi:hypothetical protein